MATAGQSPFPWSESFKSIANHPNPNFEYLLSCESLSRTAKVAIPATSAGQKVPVVFHFHGAGGHGNTHPFGNFLGDDAIIVAPDGYENTW